eukprot:61768-Hanusia_phi.AAC.1
MPRRRRRAHSATRGPVTESIGGRDELQKNSFCLALGGEPDSVSRRVSLSDCCRWQVESLNPGKFCPRLSVTVARRPLGLESDP